MQYWYNVDSGQVESDEDRSPNANVMGPYDTPEAAQNALQTAHAKSEQWDEEDRRWNDEGQR